MKKKVRSGLKSIAVLLGLALAVLAGARNASADIINFAAAGYVGYPSYFSASVAASPVIPYTGGNLTLTGGGFLSAASNLPADEGTVYGTASFAPWATSSTMTLTFSSPIDNFFVDLYNGETYTENYTVSDNNGLSETFSIAPNLSSGYAFVSIPSTGSVITITDSDPWDFLIDNIGFNEPTPTVPEPATLSLLGLGLAGLICRRALKR